MSAYSSDSLDEENEISSRNSDTLRIANDDFNLIPNENLNNRSFNVQSRLKPNASLEARTENAESNETALSRDTDKDTRTAGSRNAVIANGGFADASRRRRATSSRNKKLDVAKCLGGNKADSSKERIRSANKRVSLTCAKRSAKMTTTKGSCCPKETSMLMKADKRLGNVLAQRVELARKPLSYLELYRRRFSGPRCNVQSLEGSTLSVCGDSQQEQLSDDDTCLPVSPRDDRSELSFYRRLIEESTDPFVAATASAGTNVHQRESDDSNSSLPLDMVKLNTTDDKSKKGPSYRPYTIEEYKTLSVPKLDRSLGPDKVEMQAKREWLMRRRSYGNSVSAYNRQRILLQAQKFQSKFIVTRNCSLPPLVDQEADTKTQEDSISSTISEDQETTRKNSNTSRTVAFRKKNLDVGKISSSKKSKRSQRRSSFSSSSNFPDVIEDSYLESLKQRHLHEKEVVDRIINQVLRP